MLLHYELLFRVRNEPMKYPYLLLSKSLFNKTNIVYFAGSPYKFHVDNIGDGTLTAYGPGLVQGVAGEPCSITVSNNSNSIGKILKAKLQNY